MARNRHFRGCRTALRRQQLITYENVVVSSHRLGDCSLCYRVICTYPHKTRASDMNVKRRCCEITLFVKLPRGTLARRSQVSSPPSRYLHLFLSRVGFSIPPARRFARLLPICDLALSETEQAQDSEKTPCVIHLQYRTPICCNMKQECLFRQIFLFENGCFLY